MCLGTGMYDNQNKRERRKIVFNLFSSKNSAAVFVDYEHWYYGYNNIFSMKPNVEEWYSELKEEYSVKDIIFFGDFHGSSIEKELPRLKKITKNIVVHKKLLQKRVYVAIESDNIDDNTGKYPYLPIDSFK